MKTVYSYDEQLRLWLDGESVHVDIFRDGQEECCPDFSCCQPSLLWDKNVREKFASLPKESEERHQMLMMSLGACLATAVDKNIHIAGDEPQSLN